MQKSVICLLVLLITVNVSWSTVWNNTSGTSANWDVASNWYPAGVPGSSTKVQFSRDTSECIINSAAVSGQLVVGDNGLKDLVHKLTIVDGGSLICGGTEWAASGYNRSSIVTIEEGGRLESVTRFGVGLVAGPVGAPQTSYVIINGGEMSVNGSLQIGYVGDGTTKSDHTGIINVNGGLLEVTDSLEFRNTSVAFIDIKYGTIIVKGNVTSLVADMANNVPANITGFGGEGTVRWDYGVTNAGKTTIWADPHDSLISGDVDGDGDVDITDLSLLSAEWLQDLPDPEADFTGDKKVNLEDYEKLALNWNFSSDPIHTTLHGMVMCGYQGWFNAPGDGANRGWVHWGSSGRFEPGYCTIDMWPDMSEYDEDEKFTTGFNYSDGSTAHVFSSNKEKTVLRHFSWMKDYGIDGVFLQRFATETTPGSSGRRHRDTVMLHCRKGANEYNRAWAMMYDLSGLKAGGTQRLIDDWKYLVDTYKVSKDLKDNAYLYHNEKPVIALWGIGFNDREYTLDECLNMVNFFKNDPDYGGMTVMLGVPSYWRTLSRDCVNDSKVHEIILAADIVSPWSVGRFGSKYASELNNYADNVWAPDINWCTQNDKDYLPVVFPGFSWYNNKYDPIENPNVKFDHIPRLGGNFLWRQFYKAKNAGATMIYQAMFDEVDEGTAIFKVTNNPPVAEEPDVFPSTPFLPTGNAQHPPYDINEASLPSDHYLWLVGEAGRMLRGEIAPSANMPAR